jgi:hypothetical protein
MTMDKTNETLAEHIGDKQPQRRRTLAEVITEKEAKAPPLPQGHAIMNGRHRAGRRPCGACRWF